MNVGDLANLLSCIDSDLSVVIETEKGTTEASSISIFKNVRNEIVVQVE